MYLARHDDFVAAAQRRLLADLVAQLRAVSTRPSATLHERPRDAATVKPRAPHCLVQKPISKARCVRASRRVPLS
jgi:hypothetical protein